MAYNYLDYDNNLLNFGKFSNRTYKYVYENEFKYTYWVNSQINTKCKAMEEFQHYIRSRNIENNVVNEFIRFKAINATSVYLSLPELLKQKFLKYMNVINYIKPFYDYDCLDQMEYLGKLSTSEQGILIDYTVRYLIAKRFNLKITDDRAEGFKNLLGESYEKFKDLSASMQDIYIVSMAHSMFFLNLKGKFEDLTENPKTIFSTNFKFIHVDEWIETNIKLELKVIELNPDLGNPELMIAADADLILGENEIIDIKFVKYVDRFSYFIQLLVYAACYKVKFNKYVTKLRYVNFKTGEECQFSITQLQIDEMINTLKESYKGMPPKITTRDIHKTFKLIEPSKLYFNKKELTLEELENLLIEYIQYVINDNYRGIYNEYGIGIIYSKRFIIIDEFVDKMKNYIINKELCERIIKTWVLNHKLSHVDLSLIVLNELIRKLENNCLGNVSKILEDYKQIYNITFIAYNNEMFCNKLHELFNFDYDWHKCAEHPEFSKVVESIKIKFEQFQKEIDVFQNNLVNDEFKRKAHKNGICPITGNVFKEVDKGYFNDRPFMSVEIYDIRCSECNFRLEYYRT